MRGFLPFLLALFVIAAVLRVDFFFSPSSICSPSFTCFHASGYAIQ